jgi:hypothetical protein
MATYVSLANEVLRRLNEVQIDAAGDGFDTLRNVQALAKDAINSSIRRILQDGQEWPFIKTTTTQTLTIGVTTYNFPSDYSSADWGTFYVKKLVSVNNNPQVLNAISFEEYTSSRRASDDNAPSTGLGVPSQVFQTYGSAFGVTPSPNAVYEVEYTYWTVPNNLTLYNDVSIIPDRFSHVVIDGAMMYMMQFRSNAQSAQMHQASFEDGIKAMRNVLMDDKLNMRSAYIVRTRQRTSAGIA